MSTSANSDFDSDLTNEIAQLRRQLGRLLRRLNQRADPDADYTIDAWCGRHGLSRAAFYKLEREGRGPQVIRTGGVVRISAAADAEWERKYSAASATPEKADSS